VPGCAWTGALTRPARPPSPDRARRSFRPMTPSPATLHGFAYGEHLEGPAQRSLGFRLLAPGEQEPWCAEVEALARRLHTAPYPDHWPPVGLFCSVLLA